MLVKTGLSREIIDFLKKDLPVTVNCLGLMENRPELDAYTDDVRDPKGIIIRKGYFSYIYTKEDSFIDDVIDTFINDGEYGFAGVYGSLADKIKDRFKVEWAVSGSLYYRPDGELDLSLIKNTVKGLDIKDVDTVFKYHKYQNDEYYNEIKDSILNRPSSAIYVDGELACWVLVHEDDLLGFMYTREEYRHKGYALDVTIDLLSKIIKKGKVPALMIESDNSMSPGLAQKCGFIKHSRQEWFGISTK